MKVPGKTFDNRSRKEDLGLSSYVCFLAVDKFDTNVARHIQILIAIPNSQDLVRYF